MRLNIGSIARWDGEQDILVSPDYVVFKCLNDADRQIDPEYLDHFRQSDAWKQFVTEGGDGGVRVRIYYRDLALVRLLLPDRDEQEKIAACLSSLDTLIAAQTDKLDALKTHKKGLMQQLFPREGETVPRLRFPEFWEAGEWQRKTLEKVSSAIFDGTHQTPAYTVEGIPFFSVENIVSGKANKFISREDYLVATSKNKPEKGDILITRIGKIGFSVVVDWDYAFSIYVTLAVIKKSEVFDSFYLNGYFQSERYQKEILANSLLTAVPCKINMDELRKTEILLPTIHEQQKIAACLSSLDTLIAAQTDTLDALKIHKQGLMQQLFPSPDAVAA
jgi:type I restriction enzyme, S subunit